MIRASFVATTRSVSRCAGSVMERMTVGTCLMRRIVVSTAASVSLSTTVTCHWYCFHILSQLLYGLFSRLAVTLAFSG